VEKPVAETTEELAQLDTLAKRPESPILCVGFNRRFSVLTEKMRELLSPQKSPKVFLYTVNAPWTPPSLKSSSEMNGRRILNEGCHFIDLLRFLAASPIRSFHAARAFAEKNGDCRSEDYNLQIHFEDGSLGILNYLGNGHPRVPKERLEVFCAGSVLQMDNFRYLQGYGWPGFKRLALWHQDKGHARCVDAFLSAIRNGAVSPTPWSEVREVHQVCLALVEQLGR
jgi:predicted dehydrogenase